MAEAVARLILARHGQSAANADDVFTGWSNPPLTPFGRDEACGMARKLIEAHLRPARVFCSPLDRCTETVGILIQELDLGGVPVVQDTRLNERDYGLLTGRRKGEIAQLYGADQVRRWRRSYAETPPMGESLRDTSARVLRVYVEKVLPAAMTGGTTLIVSSGNALRSLVMALDGLDEREIEGFDISTGAMILYELGSNTGILGRSILQNRMDPE